MQNFLRDVELIMIFTLQALGRELENILSHKFHLLCSQRSANQANGDLFIRLITRIPVGFALQFVFFSLSHLTHGAKMA